MSDEYILALKAAIVAAFSGALARLALALYAGVRSIVLLAIESLVGIALGLMGAGVAIYMDPAFRGEGYALLMLGGWCGFCGALGTRAIDMATRWLEKRLGVKAR